MNFESFFDLKSVAMIGASHHKGKVGYEILVNMIRAGYKGKIIPANPNADTGIVYHTIWETMNKRSSF